MNPNSFDATGYVSDLRAAGYAIGLSRGSCPWYIGHGSNSGFGLDFLNLQKKWGPAFESDPHAVERVRFLLLLEDAGMLVAEETGR